MCYVLNLLIIPYHRFSGSNNTSESLNRHIAASAHMAAAIPNCPYIEYLPSELCDSALRRDLVSEPLEMKDGIVKLPEKPGLGVELNIDALKAYSI